MVTVFLLETTKKSIQLIFTCTSLSHLKVKVKFKIKINQFINQFLKPTSLITNLAVVIESSEFKSTEMLRFEPKDRFLGDEAKFSLTANKFHSSSIKPNANQSDSVNQIFKNAQDLYQATRRAV